MAENDGTDQVYSTVTTSAGEFTFQDLPLGSYTVSVTGPALTPLGFRKSRCGLAAFTTCR